MKTQESNKKLRLNKETIAALYNLELDEIRGGTTNTCAGSFHSECPCQSCAGQAKCKTPPPDPNTL